jgi:hypothetical protein
MNQIIIFLATQCTKVSNDDPDQMLELSQKVLNRSLQELDRKYTDTSWLFVPFMFPGYGSDPEMTVCLEINDEYFHVSLADELIRIFKIHWKKAISELHDKRGTIKNKLTE